MTGLETTRNDGNVRADVVRRRRTPLIVATLTVAVLVVAVPFAAHRLSEPAGPSATSVAAGAPAANDPDTLSDADAVGDPDAESGIAKARTEAASKQNQAAVVTNAAPAGWSGESLFNATGNDWEPAVAAAPNSAYVYALTTRYGGTPACKSNCPNPALVLRVSSNAGATWGAESYLCACKNIKAQNDPELVVLASGTVYAAWMNGWAIVFSKSTNHGATWSTPVTVVGNLAWSDKPIMVASPTGKDVFVAFNKSDAYVAVSHDSGLTWTQVVSEANGRYHFANGGTYLPDGTVAFGEVAMAQDSTGPSQVQVHRSTNNGASWSVVNVDTAQEMPHCVSAGCSIDFYGPQAALATDATGRLVLAYNANATALAPQRLLVRTSLDKGVTWTSPKDVTGITGSGTGTAGAAFPAVAATGTGDLRLLFMDDRSGAAGWATWYTRSTDGGSTWSSPLMLSDATSGPSYVTAAGFAQPYGDYGQIAVRADGGTIAAWGEGVSYTGPGGTWLTRTTP